MAIRTISSNAPATPATIAMITENKNTVYIWFLDIFVPNVSKYANQFFVICQIEIFFLPNQSQKSRSVL